MSELQKLTELRKEAAAALSVLKEDRKAITKAVETRGDADFTEDEAAEHRALTEKIVEAEDRLDDLDKRVAKAEEDEKRSGRQDERIKEILKSTTTTDTKVKEPLTYQRGNGFSYFRDLSLKTVGLADDASEERLRRHRVDAQTDREMRKLAGNDPEFRDLNQTPGTGGYSIPPLWMMNQFIELARAGRAYANLCPTQPIPPGTNSINIPKVLTGTAAAIQTADNTSVNQQDATDTFINAPVRTIAGQEGISIQVMEMSPISFDELIFRDLARDYATKLDVQVIAGTGSSGQVTGVRNTAGISTVTVTSAGSAGKVATVYAAIANAIQQVHNTRFLPPEVIVMHPRRWAWFLSAVDSTGRPLVVPNSNLALNPAAEQGGVVAQQVVGTLQGLPVVTDPSLPTNLGASTNQDVIHVLRASDLLLFESSTRARALQETKAQNLTVLLQIYGFLAFSAARYPQSVVEVGGALLTAPAFDGSGN